MMRDQPSTTPWDTSRGVELVDALEQASSVVSPAWSFVTQGKIRSLAAWRADGPDNYVLVGSEDKNAYLLTGDGRLRWRHEADAWSVG